MRSSDSLIQMNSAKNWAGGEVHVYCLSKELIALGEQVTLVCRPGSEIDKKFRTENMPVLNLPLRGALDVISARELARYCKMHSVRLIHAHLGRDYWIALAAKLFNPDIKVVITRHLLRDLKNSILHKWIYKKVDKVIAVSKAVADSLSQFPAEKITTIHNGIDIEKFQSAQPGKLRKELGIDERIKIVGMVGQVSPHKGQTVFIQSISAIAQKHPQTQFVVIGDDFKNGEYIAQLKRLNEKVCFLGPRTNIPELMADLDVFVLASRSEPFGLVTVEAMAAGAAVVATNTGGSSEIVTEGETGILIQPDHPQELADAVNLLLGDQELCNKFIEAGKCKVAASFTLRRMSLKTLDAYRALFSNEKAD